MNWPTKPTEWIVAALRVGVGAVFIGASLYKIASPGAFAHQIYNYHLIPSWAINPSALIVPWIQLIGGMCLILNRLPLGSAFLITGMMAVFQGAVASALVRGLNISCGCFKSGGAPATWLTFTRDSSLLIAALIVLVMAWRADRTRRPSYSA